MAVKNPVDMTDEEFSQYLQSLSDSESPADDISAQSMAEDISQEDMPEISESDTAEEVPEEIPAEVTVQKTEVTPSGGETEKILSIAKVLYPDDADPISRLIGDLESTAAAYVGEPLDQWRTKRAEQEEFDAWKKSKADALRRDEEAAKIADGWRADEAKIKKFVPDFDFKTAMENPAFKNAIFSGQDIFSAYGAANPPAVQKAAPQTAGYIDEVGAVGDVSTGTKGRDVADMSDAEFRDYIKRIQNS